MKSAKLWKLISLLQIQENKAPKPKDSQVLVKVQSYGVYHKDIYLLEGAYER
jgi:D-arabinose 1-dehydrogenase-like Zn-dependent alcohol dehydrogenase